MWSMLLIAAAHAAVPATTEATTIQPAVLTETAKRRRKKKGKKGGGPGWKSEAYGPRLSLGGSSFTDTNGNTVSAVAVGGEIGLHYWQLKHRNPFLVGKTRAVAHYVVSSGDATGMEIKLGSFLGPQWSGRGGSYVRLQAGPDLFWNRYSFGDVNLDPTVGLAFPVMAYTGVSLISLHAGFEPAWVDNEERRVDWDEQEAFGFGHQFSTFMGGQVRLGGIGSVGLSYIRTITAGGVQQGYGVSMNLRR